MNAVAEGVVDNTASQRVVDDKAKENASPVAAPEGALEEDAGKHQKQRKDAGSHGASTKQNPAGQQGGDKNGRHNKKDGAPTPAESADRRKKLQDQRKGHGGKNASVRNRSKKMTAGKKGSWKKLDVDINFNKGQPSREVQPGQNVRHDGGGGGGRGNQYIKKAGRGHYQQPNSGRCRRHGGKAASSGETSDVGRRGNGRTQRSRGPHFIHPSPEEYELCKKDAVRQVEYFFSEQELCKNVFLRQNMDTEGFLPAAIIFNFPSVVKYGVDYFDLLATIDEKSSKVEVDGVNETLRLKHNHTKWLFPNEMGGLGCPRWIKQVEVAQEQQETTESEGTNSVCVVPAGLETSTTQKGAAATNETDSATTVEGVKHLVIVDSEKKISCRIGDDSTNGSGTPELSPCTDSDTDHTDGGDSRGSAL